MRIKIKLTGRLKRCVCKTFERIIMILREERSKSKISGKLVSKPVSAICLVLFGYCLGRYHNSPRRDYQILERVNIHILTFF